MFEASLAVAAINSWYNRRDVVESATGRPLEVRRGARVFERLSLRFAGRHVAVVGHFPHLGPLRERCHLTILERRPSAGDLPDQACVSARPARLRLYHGERTDEPDAAAFARARRDAYVALIGPSLPLAPLWFDYGVDLLAGTVVLSHDEAAVAVQQGARRSVFGASLATVEIEAGEWDASRAQAARPPT